MDLTHGNHAISDEDTDAGASRPAGGPGTTSWRSIAAALVIGLVGGGLSGGYATFIMQGDRQVATAENEILSAHLRALIAPQPFDIASSDNHVVKPWFNGRTRIAPMTPDFATAGFQLVGGRVDIIAGEPVPVLVYKRRQHTISVTVTKSSVSDAGAAAVLDGTNVRRWTDGGLTYWALSDLNPGELSSFADLYRRKPPVPPEENPGIRE